MHSTSLKIYLFFVNETYKCKPLELDDSRAPPHAEEYLMCTKTYAKKNLKFSSK